MPQKLWQKNSFEKIAATINDEIKLLQLLDVNQEDKSMI